MQKERKLNRLKNYDYSKPGYYYLTICVHPDLRWKNIFGKIQNGNMELNEYGEIVLKQWLWIEEQYKPLTQIIGAFKTTSSKMIHMTGYNSFTWQRSYYDHIIRDVYSLIRIRKYIINNPANWECNNIK